MADVIDGGEASLSVVLQRWRSRSSPPSHPQESAHGPRHARVPHCEPRRRRCLNGRCHLPPPVSTASACSPAGHSPRPCAGLIRLHGAHPRKLRHAARLIPVVHFFPLRAPHRPHIRRRRRPCATGPETPPRPLGPILVSIVTGRAMGGSGTWPRCRTAASRRSARTYQSPH